jgi:hypothetical protein
MAALGGHDSEDDDEVLQRLEARRAALSCLSAEEAALMLGTLPDDQSESLLKTMDEERRAQVRSFLEPKPQPVVENETAQATGAATEAAAVATTAAATVASAAASPTESAAPATKVLEDTQERKVAEGIEAIPKCTDQPDSITPRGVASCSPASAKGTVEPGATSCSSACAISVAEPGDSSGSPGKASPTSPGKDSGVQLFDMAADDEEVAAEHTDDAEDAMEELEARRAALEFMEPAEAGEMLQSMAPALAGQLLLLMGSDKRTAALASMTDAAQVAIADKFPEDTAAVLGLRQITSVAACTHNENEASKLNFNPPAKGVKRWVLL